MREFLPKNNPVNHYQSDVQRRVYSPQTPFRKQPVQEGFFFEKMLKKIFGGIWRVWKNSPKIVKWIIVILILGAVGAWITLRIIHNPQQKNAQVYEALVMPVDQKKSNAIEDAKSSLKYGDVIAVFLAGHNWSDTEKNSYLIVKIKLTKDEAAKLTQPKTKKTDQPAPNNLPVNSKDGKANKDQKQLPMMETILAREYRLKLPDFDIQKFWGGGGQPFSDKIFDDGIIQKK